MAKEEDLLRRAALFLPNDFKGGGERGLISRLPVKRV
jgi:hypothetical protein